MGFRGKYLRSYKRATCVAILLAVPVAAQSQDDPPSSIRIDNFGRINDNYFRGAQPEGQDYEDLAALGVKTIIDLTDNGDAKERSIVEDLGMKFFRIPMTTRRVPSAGQVAEFLQLVRDPANQPVYVHCQGGRHRTGLMTAVYRMTADGWTGEKAFAEMKQYKFGADFLHPEFKRFVHAFHSDRNPAAVGGGRGAIASK